MNKPKVFVTRIIPEAGLSRIEAACETEVWQDALPPPRDVLEERVRDCDGLLSLLSDPVDRHVLVAAPRLRVVSNYAVGFNNIDVAAATEMGIAVGNTPGVLTDATADMAMTLLLGAARRLVESNRYAQAGRWKTWEPLGHVGQDLVGRTLGIVGMGRIGMAVARRCHGGWGMRVLYHDVNRVEEAEAEFGAERVEFGRLLAESDFVSVHVDLNESTRHLFDAAAFAAMKRTAVFVNTARGGVVDQTALCLALQAGEIFAAGLDVTRPEPPVSDDPLWRLPNVVLAPHIASATVETRDRMAMIAADNLLAGLAGTPLPHWVNPEVAGNLRTG